MGNRGWTFGWHYQLSGHEFEQTLGDSEDREAWHAAVQGVTKSQTGLSDWTAIRITVSGQARNPT